ncbi:cardiolipin synthase [Cohnella sp. GCM10027633]|uniref:cardiolipin synthase n=1 Tax=unclassified Cohnella TaxID=2636738 RepID=UPI00362B7EC3
MIWFWLCILLLIFIFQAATILLLEFRRPGNAAAWLFILFLFPLVGFTLYYFLATEYRRRRTTRKRGKLDIRRRGQIMALGTALKNPSDLPDPVFASRERLFKALVKNGQMPIFGRNRTEVYDNGEETYEAMLAAIRGATHHIHLSTYILRNDETGMTFQQELLRKAREGVTVRLLYDGIGSIKLSDGYVKTLREGGVRCACFFPLRPSFLKKRMNYRNHRKIVVVDGLVGFIGGINVGDEYIGRHPRLGFWRDTHLRIEGDAVYRLQEVFLKDWELATRDKPDDPKFLPPHACESAEPVQIVHSGPSVLGEAIHDSVYAVLTAARHRIWITTPYFIPSTAVAMALRDAAVNGVDVRIVVPYVPDTWLVHLATLSYVETMLQSGVRVWRYRKGFIHAKTTIVDDMVGIVGSANMDLRSYFSNFEINAHLFDPGTIKRLEADYLTDLEGSEELILSEFMRRPRSQKVKEALARLLSPLL